MSNNYHTQLNQQPENFNVLNERNILNEIASTNKLSQHTRQIPTEMWKNDNILNGTPISRIPDSNARQAPDEIEFSDFEQQNRLPTQPINVPPEGTTRNPVGSIPGHLRTNLPEI